MLETNSEQKSILFVDDEPEVGRIFAKMATRLGYQVDVVNSGSDALAIVSTVSYPVIVTDLCMPGVDGLALLEAVRTLSPTSVTMLVTGVPELELPSANAKDCSLAAILRKPFDLAEVEKALTCAFSIHNEQRGEEAKNGNHRVLLVEDDPLDACLAQTLLSRDFPEAEVHTVSRVREAESFLSENAVTTILTDLSLPDARGIDAVSRLRAAGGEAAIVVLSGSQCEKMAVSALKHGAHDYLLKDSTDGPSIRRSIRYAQERKEHERQLVRLAYHDPLSGLPNRKLFRDRLVQALARARREETSLSVVFIDLDRFKVVNDSLGHEAGDRLLRTIADRLSGTLRETDTVARLGGDEFAAFMEGANQVEVTRLCQRLISAVKEPMLLCGELVTVGCSLGAAAFPSQGFTADGLLRAADAAMYKSKKSGRGRLHWAGEQATEEALGRLRLEADLRRAVYKGEFELFYQPQFSTDSREVICCEALLRWNRDGQLHPPSEFIPVLDELKLWEEVGPWILREACREAMSWPSRVAVAVNLSAQQLNDSLPGMVAKALEQSGLPATRLELEITETALVKDQTEAVEVMSKLTKMGVSFALDDFGTGFSSLAYLRRFPVSRLKIDRQFLIDPEHQAVTAAIIKLGHALGLHVVAEGVEVAEQLLTLEAEQCDQVQGYLLARPMSSQKLRGWWAEQHPELERAAV